MNVLLKGAEAQIVEKKSRFLAETAAVHSEEEAAAFLESVRKKYWDARHHCSAWTVGFRQPLTHASDDGEPSGTAGRPILDVLTGADLTDAMIVVTRYFGGTLLGTGGLVRAYQGAAREALAASVTAPREEGFLAEAAISYEQVGRVQYIAGQMGLCQADAVYGTGVTLSWYLSGVEFEQFSRKLTEACAGRTELTKCREVSFARSGGEVILLS